MDCVFNPMILGSTELHLAGLDYDVSERKVEASLREVICNLPKLSTKPHSNIEERLNFIEN